MISSEFLSTTDEIPIFIPLNNIDFYNKQTDEKIFKISDILKKNNNTNVSYNTMLSQFFIPLPEILSLHSYLLLINSIYDSENNKIISIL